MTRTQHNPKAADIVEQTGQPVELDANVIYQVGSPDPLMDACPSWCDYLLSGHRVQSCDEDRNHYGPTRQVVLRHRTASHFIPPKDEGAMTYQFGYVEMYLRRNVLHRDPVIHLNLDSSGVGIDLTVAEAERIARAVLEMVESSR